MSKGEKNDPLEGFHFDDFDPETKELTIRIHEYILKNPRQKRELIDKMAEILDYDGSLNSITVDKRD